MHKVVVFFVIVVLLGVYAEPPRPRRPFRPLPKFQSRILGRLENPSGSPNGNGQGNGNTNSGYSYPKPEYGLPSDPQPPTTEDGPEFVAVEAEAGDVDPNITNESDINEALNNRRRIIYLGLPESQIEFENPIYYSGLNAHYEFEPYVHGHFDEHLTHAHLEPLSEIRAIPYRKRSYSSQIFQRNFY